MFNGPQPCRQPLLAHLKLIAVEREAHIFRSILIHRQMHRTKRASSDLILDDILIDMMLRSSIRLIICIRRPRIKRLLNLTMLRRITAVVSEGTLVCGC